MQLAFSIILTLIGVVLIAMYSHWVVALGVFFMVWSHNIDKHWDDIPDLDHV